MKTIDITAPDGKTLTISAPDEATPDQIKTAAQQAATHYSQTLKPQSPMDKSMQQEGPGLQDVSATPLTGPDIQQGGQQAAEAIGAKGYPTAGAAVGTAIQMAPDIAGAAAGFPAEKAGAELAGQGLAKAGAAIGDVVNVLKNPGEKEARLAADSLLRDNAPQAAKKAQTYMTNAAQSVKDSIAQFQTRIKQLPVDMDHKQAILDGFKRAAGDAMGQAEPKFDMGQLQKDLADPTAIRQLADTMSRWAGQTGKELANSGIPAENIQYMRKFAQEAGQKLEGMSNAVVQKGRQTASEALENMSPAFSEARQKYLQIADAINDLPAEASQKKAAFQQAIIQGKNQLSQLQAQAKQLMASAKGADAAQLADTQKQASDLISQGLQHDRYVANLWNAVKTAGATGLAAAGIKKFGGY